MILTPFGPKIYYDKISDDIKTLLLDISNESDLHVGPHLVGQIEDERYIYLPHKAEEEIKFHTNKYLSEFCYEITSCWVNYQKRYEWNPPHRHNSDLSFIIYLQIPKELQFEEGQFSGKISFTYGEPQKFNRFEFGPFLPKENEIYIFPSWLTHQVYPFKSDVTRISVAGNLNVI
jgi:hypothetical protein